MQNLRRHYFPVNDCTVISGLCPSGEFAAYVEGNELIRGYGHSRYSANADLVEVINRAEEVTAAEQEAA